MNARLLSLPDDEQIEAELTTYAKNVRMYQIILRKVHDDGAVNLVKEAVCNGLCMSSQYCPFDIQHQQQPASAAQQDVLHRLRPRLIEDMEVPPVLDWLVQESVLNKYLREKIEAGKTNRDQVHALLSVVLCTHSVAHDTFIEILKRTNPWIFDDEVTSASPTK